MVIRFGRENSTHHTMPVERYEFVTEGHPICERLCVRVPVASANRWDWDDLIGGFGTISLVVELSYDSISWTMPGSYINDINYVHGDGLFLDIAFVYPLDTKRFRNYMHGAPRNYSRDSLPKRRKRQPVDWNRVGF